MSRLINSFPVLRKTGLIPKMQSIGVTAWLASEDFVAMWITCRWLCLTLTVFYLKFRFWSVELSSLLIVVFFKLAFDLNAACQLQRWASELVKTEINGFVHMFKCFTFAVGHCFLTLPGNWLQPCDWEITFMIRSHFKRRNPAVAIYLHFIVPFDVEIDNTSNQVRTVFENDQMM